MRGEDKRCNDLDGREWLQNSFSIWRETKTKAEKDLKHPASYPVSLCEKLIRTFSRRGSRVLDPFDGIGSTMIACKNLGSTGVGIDLSETFTQKARERLGESEGIELICGDSLKVLKKLEEDSFDLCLTSPPYWDILNQKRSADRKTAVNYSDAAEDLGNIPDYDEFISRLQGLFLEVKRVLKPGGYCLVNVMDLRKKSRFYPLHSDLSAAMQKTGYLYDDLIIWDRQQEYNNMRPLGYPYRFRINKVHEFILIMVKEG